MRLRTIGVDEHGRSTICAINGDQLAEPGAYADLLCPGDKVQLDDGTIWTVDRVYTRIQTGNPGAGTSNYVCVDITQGK